MARNQNDDDNGAEDIYDDVGAMRDHGQSRSRQQQRPGNPGGNDTNIPMSDIPSTPVSNNPPSPSSSKGYIGVIAFLVLLSLGLLAGVIFLVMTTKTASNVVNNLYVKTVSICRDPFCRRSVNDLLAIMDPTINPCEDFYNYTCGKWGTRFPANDSFPQTNPLTLLHTRLFENLSNLLKNLPNKDTVSPRGIAAFVYRECVADSQNNRVEDLRRLIREFNGWPILTNPGSETAIDNSKTIVKYTLDALVKYNLKLIFNLQILPDFIEGDGFLLSVSKSALISQSVRYHFPTRNNYATLNEIKRVVCLLNEKCDTELTHLAKDIDDMNKFDSELAAVTSDASESEDGNDDDDPKLTLGQLNKLAPLTEANWDWVEIAKYILKDPAIDENYTVLADPQLINNTFQVFLNRDVRMVKNWFVLQLIHQLGNKFVGLLRPDGISNEMRCAQEVNELMPYAAAEIYNIDWSRAPGKKGKVIEMFDKIREEIFTMVEGSYWLDEAGKAIMSEKLKNLVPFVAYPDWILNQTELSQYYQIKLTDNPTYIEASSALLGLNWHREASLLKTKLDRTTYWIRDDLLQGNAWYSPMTNSLTIPIGILDYPFVADIYQPSSVIFGMLGHIVGHEIFHALDHEGIMFDEHGKYRNEPPFSDSVNAAYLERLQCLITQYNEMGSNGEQTISEDFPDNAAMEIIHSTYRALENEIFYDDLLHNLNETQIRQFFLAFASTWCTETLEEYLPFFQDDVHSMGRFRVNVPLKNSLVFSEAFNCPNGMFMNPSQKCRIF